MSSASTSPWTLARLGAALERFGARPGAEGTIVLGLSQDSRRVQPGDLFALREADPARAVAFVEEAVARGAVALLCAPEAVPLARGLPVLSVDDVRAALAVAAEEIAGRPSSLLRLVGITGTNGKTTTASLVLQCLGALGHTTAGLGTLGFELSGRLEPFGLTTPEADQISGYLRRAREGGATHAVMEVSSHALAQRRVQALHFAVAAFSNLTQDHLDFHGSMAEYGAAKARLFFECAPEVSVLNVSDPFGRELAERLPGALRVGTAPGVDVRFRAEVPTSLGRELSFDTPSGSIRFETALLGDHNLSNWLLCLGILHALGGDLGAVAANAPGVRGAAGRFERCEGPGDDLQVIVDYAHTEDALTRVLRAARPLSRGRLVCVFGCGGDRDATKRAPMGRAAGRGADHVIVTNDNPRSEQPEQIAASIVSGLQEVGASYERCLDRAEAIRRAILGAEPGDLVLIAGKGHENTQHEGEERRPFDDRQQARRALELRRGRKDAG